MLANKTRKSRRPSKSPAEREALRKRTREVLTRELSLISNSAFHEMEEAKYWRELIRRPSRPENSTKVSKPKYANELPFDQLCDAPLLSREEERELFRGMNYLKFRVNQIRATLHENRPSVRKLEQIDAALEKSEQLRNEIIAANTRLVVSIVKKFTKDRHAFDDMLSEGITALMRAVEKFNYDRGFRFSTYATMVVRRSLYRVMERSQKTKTRFVTGHGEILDGECREDGEAGPSEKRLSSRDRQIARILSELDERERLIIDARCGFIDLGMKATLKNLGNHLGVSKERVRQLELRGMGKLREAIAQFGLIGELRDLAVR